MYVLCFNFIFGLLFLNQFDFDLSLSHAHCQKEVKNQKGWKTILSQR